MKKINESFQCTNCKNIVPPANKTCRNHCPYCFMSLHVDDEIPGDRKSNCKGQMIPVEYIFKHGVWKILFKCQKCGKEHWNKSAEDDNIMKLPEILSKKNILTLNKK